MHALIVIVLAVLRDMICVGFRSRAEILAENLFLRRQLALYQDERPADTSCESRVSGLKPILPVSGREH